MLEPSVRLIFREKDALKVILDVKNSLLTNDKQIYFLAKIRGTLRKPTVSYLLTNKTKELSNVNNYLIKSSIRSMALPRLIDTITTDLPNATASEKKFNRLLYYVAEKLNFEISNSSNPNINGKRLTFPNLDNLEF